MAKYGSENQDFQDRETEEYLAHSHNTRVESLGDWKDRIEAARAMAKGQLGYRNPDGVMVYADLQITNLADQMPRDTARLVSEVEPTYRAPINKKGEKADANAEFRAAIAQQYFAENRFDIIRPYLSMDLDMSGACFVAATVDPDMDYPRFERIDPLFAYPDIYNGRLIDLLVIQTMKFRTAKLLFPSFDWDSLPLANLKPTEDVTIMDYYGPTYNAHAIGKAGSEGGFMDPHRVHLIDKVYHGCTKLTVGFAMLPSPSGEFGGSVDQVGPAMMTKNRIVNLITEYAHEGIYAPWEEKGILNWQEDPGPDTKYHHNTNIDGETFIRRAAPAQFNTELFGLLQFLESEQRGQLGYPVTRQGDVGVSQGSASFVTATQGQLQSIVRERQRLLSMVQEDLACVAFQMDKQDALNFEKPLPHLVANKDSYVPSETIDQNYVVKVEYGAGAGLDRLNADQRLINFYTIGTLSGEMVLEQTDFVPDPRSEMQRRQNEEIDRILLEKWLSDPTVTPELIGMTLKLKKDRAISLSEAWAEVQHQVATAQAEAQQAEVAAAEQAAVAPTAGAPSAAPLPQPEFAKQAIHQVISGG